MSNLLTLYVCALLSGNTVAEQEQNGLAFAQPIVVTTQNVVDHTANENSSIPFLTDFVSAQAATNASEVILEKNEFKDKIKRDNGLDLGFETANYLPQNFDPYAVPKTIHVIDFIEEEEEVILNFNTADYLPEDFNPYEAYFNVHDLEIMVVERPLNIPALKQAQLKSANDFNVHSIDFIEQEEEIVLGFDTKAYLPKNFNAYDKGNK